jgi:hypothetical protein
MGRKSQRITKEAILTQAINNCHLGAINNSYKIVDIKLI